MPATAARRVADETATAAAAAMRQPMKHPLQTSAQTSATVLASLDPRNLPCYSKFEKLAMCVAQLKPCDAEYLTLVECFASYGTPPPFANATYATAEKS